MSLYFQYQIAFDYIDTSDDSNISFEEFAMMSNQLKRWEIDMRDIQAQWDDCDFTKEGHVSFMEFSDWAFKKKMELESDLEDEDSDKE